MNIELNKDIIQKDPSKLINKCPATILAESRIERVIGRIILLINSINTIKFINILGVPKGTKWINLFLKFLIHL